MQTAKEAREARRKRILERGSDRLAYITGDTSKQHSVKASPIASPQGGSSFTVQSTAEDILHSFDDSQTVEDFQERVSGPSPTQALASEPSPTMQALALSNRVLEQIRVTPSPIAPASSDLLQTRKAANKFHTTYVTSIVQSIEASEVLRAAAAALVAVLVVMQSVLSCCGHPWGNMLTIFLPRWPLILVCITDSTLVVGAYTFHSQNKNSRKPLGGSSSFEGLDGSFDKISKALDVVGQFENLLNLGLLLKKAAGATEVCYDCKCPKRCCLQVGVFVILHQPSCAPIGERYRCRFKICGSSPLVENLRCGLRALKQVSTIVYIFVEQAVYFVKKALL